MRFTALVMSVESRTYDTKAQKGVRSHTLTAVDFDPSNVRLKDSFDCTIVDADWVRYNANPVGQILTFDCSEISAPRFGTRMQFRCALVFEQATNVPAETPPLPTRPGRAQASA